MRIYIITKQSRSCIFNSRDRKNKTTKTLTSKLESALINTNYVTLSKKGYNDSEMGCVLGYCLSGNKATSVKWKIEKNNAIAFKMHFLTLKKAVV